MTAVHLVSAEDTLYPQRIVVHCVPVELGARTPDVVYVHAKVLRRNLWFFVTVQTRVTLKLLCDR